MAPSAITDDSAHGMTNPAFEPSEEEAKAQMKLQQDLEGAVSPLEPVTLNPPRRHCDPHNYRYTDILPTSKFHTLTGVGVLSYHQHSHI